MANPSDNPIADPTTNGAPIDALADVLPLTARADRAGVLKVGGCSVRDLAGAFGTPLYIYDEHTIRQTCRD
ncbi:MAG: diaminopimelate decarboxylase, partial [Chloroflexi bacterium]|nr:diaminopimelate decarboxylase [Chloroflexota bacterium]